MKISEHAPQLTLPPAFRRQLAKFRQRVWAFKMLAAGCAAGVALGASFLIVFAVDRVWDTPGWLRALLLVLAAITAMVLLPVAYYRWVWGSRRLRDVARIVSHIHPRMGDRLLGIVELVEAKSSQQASPALCRAAIEQVANESVTHGCWKRIPHPTHRRWAWSLAAVSAMGACALAVPGAGINAWQRWTLPWRSIPRFTFVQLTESPRVLYVPTGERFHVSATLTESSRWSPTKGIGSYGDQ
ncbi:MAG: hypothetical protein KDA60_13120, partial [Planctomycetales bacterium]|nr:hypothetical protein [Planctomycetales bacterium]